MRIDLKLIVVDREVEGLPMTKRVCERLSGIEIVHGKEVIERIKPKTNAITEGKRILHLTKSSGESVKDCPGTNEYLCCGYKVLNVVENCSMECTYCILQHYLTDPVIRIHADRDKIFSDLDTLLNSDPKRLFRIGSGELSDSLLYDPISDFSLDIIPFLNDYPNVMFEFKTKTAEIANLLKHDLHPRNIVIGWSLNTPRIIANEEKKTASLLERLGAARICSERGYKIAFHFDPIIMYENYLAEYAMVVDEIFQRVSPEHIAWISLGMLRYPPNLKRIIQKRFPRTRIIYGETVYGNDGKIRYFKKHRLTAFRELYERIYQHTRGTVFVYFCMESPEIWKKVAGFSPKDNRDFADIFHRHLYF